MSDWYAVVPVGLQAAFGELIKCYPNPVNAVLHIENAGNVNRLEVFGSNGRLVRSNDNTGNTTIDLNLSELEQGIYFLRLIDNAGNVATRRILKQ